MSHLAKLKELLFEINALRESAAVLEWDHHTYMPPGGAPARSEQLAVISRIAHDKQTSDEMRMVLDGAGAQTAGLDADSLDAHLVRMARFDFDLATKLPSDLVAESTRVASMAQAVWAQARKDSDYATFSPWLQKTIDIARRKIDLYGYEDQPYDALLNLYEPHMKARDVARLFDQVRPVVVAIVKATQASGAPIDRDVLKRHYPQAAQEKLSKEAVAAFGYDFNRGRLDPTVHPFATSFGRDDVRITTRYDESFLPMALMGCLHECGHAMYEQNTAPELVGTPLAGGCSLGVHESQSRLWENLVGRSRGYWNYFFPKVAEAFPEAMKGVDADSLYRALNVIAPSLIRVEADEVTYNLHIVLRFELEQELLSGNLKVSDAPEAWNAKMEQYLGITPPTDALGVLQDVHWSMGGMGYFPTYSLGNFLSVQLYETAVAQIPSIPGEIAQGRFESLFNWLKENVWADGRRRFPDEQVRKATGRPLETGPYINYLKAKTRDVYGISI